MKTATYQPKTGEACHCKPGVQRDNCPDCEGTGQRIDFAVIRARNKPLQEKVKDYVERQITMADCKDCFAIPGETIIDVLHPVTGLTLIYGKTLDECQLEDVRVVKMTVEEFCKSKAAKQDTAIEWAETTEEKFDEMLEVLPPAMWERGAFLVGEAWDHHALTGEARFAAYRKLNGKYLTASRPMSRRELKAILNGEQKVAQ